MKWIAALLLLACSPLAANCVTPSGYSGHVKLARMQAVVLHRGAEGDEPGYEELLLKLQPYFSSPTEPFNGGVGEPASMAWVIPIPSKAVRHEVIDTRVLAAGPALHDKLFQLARDQWAAKSDFQWPEWLPSNLKKREEPAVAEVEPPAPVTEPVGAFEITQIEGSGAAAVTALSRHLASSGFAAINQDDLKFYTENDFTFVCVRVSPPAGKSVLGLWPELPTLAIGFETERPYVPLMNAAGMGDFALDVTLVTDKPLETDAFGELRRQLNPINHGYVQLVNLYTLNTLPEALAAGLSERATKDDPSRWYANRIESKAANTPGEEGAPLSALAEDGLFTIGDITDEIPGFWYYGDEDISFIDRFFREHAMAVFVGLGLVFFVTLFIKVRINRKRYLAAKAAGRPEVS